MYTYIYIYIYIERERDFTPDITNMKIHWKMPLRIHWEIQVKMHWGSDNPLENITEKWHSVGKHH